VFAVLCVGLFTHCFHFCRKWYISLVPPGCNPGTTEGVDFYAAAANVNTGYRDTLPPGAGWMTFGEDAGSPPSHVYHFDFDEIDEDPQVDTQHTIDSNSLSRVTVERSSSSQSSLDVHEEVKESCSQTICTPQSEISQNQNPEGMLSAFDKLTPEQKNLAIAAAANRTNDSLKEWSPPPRDECPICFVPLPIDDNSTSYRPCCGMIVCKGCIADQVQMFIRDSGDEMQEEMIKALNQCMFCRTNMYGKSDELNRAAAENNRPEGMFRVGLLYLADENNQEGMKWLKRATVLGCGKAAEKIGDILLEDDNETQARFYFNKAAELGRVQSFVKLGSIDLNRGNITTAMDNYRKAATCGVNSKSLVQVLKRGFIAKYITREEYFSTLYKHYKANDEMNSESRKRALHKW